MALANEDIQETRRHQRIRDNIAVRWRIAETNVEGFGRVRNISQSGLMLIADRTFTPLERCRVFIESLKPERSSYLPDQGTLVWAKQTDALGSQYNAGITFDELDSGLLENLILKIEQGLTRIKQAAQLQTLFGIILSLVMIVLTGYVIKLWTGNYHVLERSNEVSLFTANRSAKLYRDVNSKYYETSAQLARTTDELVLTKSELTQTRSQLLETQKELTATLSNLTQTRKTLTQVQQENEALAKEIARLEQVSLGSADKNAKLEAVIEQMKKQHTMYGNELQSLREQLAFFSTDVSSVAEGKSMLLRFKNQIKKVKTNIGALKDKALQAKVAAQSKKDALETLLGNGGFLLIDGENTALKSDQDVPPSVNIDVQFIE